MKLDKDFTVTAMNSARDYELYKNIISMVHSINIRLCAEGIEEREWCKKMEKMEIDYLQGYYFSKPVNEDKFLEVISA